MPGPRSFWWLSEVSPENNFRGPRKVYRVPIYGRKTLVSTINIQFTRKHNCRLQTLILELLIKHFNSPLYYNFSTICPLHTITKEIVFLYYYISKCLHLYTFNQYILRTYKLYTERKGEGVYNIFITQYFAYI